LLYPLAVICYNFFIGILASACRKSFAVLAKEPCRKGHT
jgi:hypothetical protein